MLRFDLERLNHLQFLDATTPSVEQGARDLLVTDMKHPVFPNFWRPGHIIGYEHTFIAALAEFLDAVSRGVDFHPNFADALDVQRVLDALQRSVRHGSGRRSRRARTPSAGTALAPRRRHIDFHDHRALGTASASRRRRGGRSSGCSRRRSRSTCSTARCINVLAPMLREAYKWSRHAVSPISRWPSRSA